MVNVFLTLLGIVVGVTATALIGRHYFRRTTDRSLTPFVHLSSSVLSDIDPEVRSDLKILFHEQQIDDLTHIQLLIANTGSRAIRDCIKPLSITFPNETNILDYSIIYKHPKERVISAKHSKGKRGTPDSIEVSFPLMNAGEFFLIKFLIDGKVDPFDLQYRITVDDLPPTLEAEWLPYSSIIKETKKLDWTAIWVGLALVAGAACIAYMLFLLWHYQPSLSPYPWKTYEFSLVNLIVFIFLAAVSMLLALLGIILMIGMGFEEVFSFTKHRFPLPDNIGRSVQFRIPSPELSMEEELSSKDTDESSNKPHRL